MAILPGNSVEEKIAELGNDGHLKEMTDLRTVGRKHGSCNRISVHTTVLNAVNMYKYLSSIKQLGISNK